MPQLFVSDEILLKEYLENHLSVKEIQEKYGFRHHSNVSRRLTKLGLPSKRHHQMNIQVTERQHQIIFGSLLGDATARLNPRNAYLKFAHSTKQLPYVEWKFQEMQPFSRKLIVYQSQGFGEQTAEFITSTLPQFTYYRELFYHNGKKVVPDDLTPLTPLALAVWFMDDGGIDKKWRRVFFASMSFTEDENLRLLDYLRYRYDLKGNLNWVGGHRYRIIVLSAKSFERFKEIVMPHLLPEFYYKVNC